MAESAQSAEVVQLERIQEVLESLSVAAASHRVQLLYVVALYVSLAEEPDEGNLHVRFCEGH